MGFEEDRKHFVGSFGPNIDCDVTANAIGGRGIDRIQKYVRSSTNWGSTWTRSNPAQDIFVYPLYDAHGNMVRTLSKTSSGGYTVSAETVVDPWGSKLSSGTDEKRDYCASIGHVTDDESGMVYMRARYYEPGMGRFVSEDIATDGLNWYVYCDNEPVANMDTSGKYKVTGSQGMFDFCLGAGILCFFSAFILCLTPVVGGATAAERTLACNLILAAASFMGLAISETSLDNHVANRYFKYSKEFIGIALLFSEGLRRMAVKLSPVVVFVMGLYGMAALGALISEGVTP